MEEERKGKWRKRGRMRDKEGRRGDTRLRNGEKMEGM